MAYAPVHDTSYEANPTFSFSSDHDYITCNRQDHLVSPESQRFSVNDAQKQYGDVDLQEVSPYWTAPHNVPSVPSHQRGWSGSTISAEAPLQKSEPMSAPSSLKNTFTPPSTDKLGGNGSWTLEIVTIVIAWAAVGSIMGVLARFNGRALPEWPYYITLNALIALLATVATATMSVSLQNGLSQLKWIRFKESRAPLTDMEAFDEASRGTWGALKLLVTARGGFLGSFGAIVAIVALALGPFAQQVVTYQTRSVESYEGASVNRAMNYTGALPGNTSETGFVPILPLKSAVYNGLFAENGRPGASLAFECQTGNCTWDPYETLAVCHECVDLTPFITQYCASSSSSSSSPDGGTEGEAEAEPASCGWQVPQGARLASGWDVFSMTSQIPAAQGDVPHSTIMRLIFMGTEAHDGLAGETKPWARQCTLSACVQTLETTVSNGVLGERVVGSYVNQTVLDISDLDDGRDLNVYTTSPSPSASAGSDDDSASASASAADSYMLGIEAMLSMRGWFGTLFATGSAVRNAAAFNRTITDNTVVVNLTVGISSGETFFDSDVVTAFYWNYYEYAGGLDLLVADAATSMTVAFRGLAGGAEAVAGRAVSVESYVHVRWGFAVLPIVVVAGAGVFLAAAVYRTRRSRAELWKSSALAMLFHGLDDEARAQFAGGGGGDGGSGGLREQKRRARGVKVQLDESVDGGSLLKG